MTEIYLHSYLAGYIDGDGCFFLKHEKSPEKYRAYLIISSTYKPVLSHFANIFGGHITKCPTKKVNYKQQYHWTIRGKFAAKLSNKITPFLIEKRRHAHLLIHFTQIKCKITKSNIINQIKYIRKHYMIDKNTIPNIRLNPINGFKHDWEYAYLAGFIDAECCFQISTHHPKDKPNPTYKIVLRCNNTNPNIFYWLHGKMGGAMTFIDRHTKNPKHKNQISWNLSGRKLSTILPHIKPWLINKKNLCDLLIQFFDTTLPNGGDRQSESFKERYESIMSKREELIHEIKSLNQKGVNNV